MPTLYTPPEIPQNEKSRLRALHLLNVLDTEPGPELDAIVRAASLVCDMPISLISLIDSDRQWFKARVGLDASQTLRDISFCGHAILDDKIFEVEDALSDSRFAGNPLVTGHPDIRFYAGVPLRLSDGSNVGTLCVIDHKPNRLSEVQRQVLRHLSVTAASLLQKTAQVKRITDWGMEAQQIYAVKARLAAIVEQSDDAMMSNDASGNVSTWNLAAERMFGYSEAELLGQPIVRLLPPERLTEDEILLRKLRSDTRIKNFETVRRHRDGHLIPVSISLSPLYGADGEFEGVSRVVRDISERIAAEHAASAGEANYKALIDAMFEGMVVQRADGSIASCNASAERLLGLSFAQMAGTKSVHPTWRCVHEDMSVWPGESYPAMQALSSGQEIRDAVMGVYKPGGDLSWISVNAKPLFDGEQEKPASVITTFVDISERKAATDALQHSEQKFSAMFESAATGMAFLSPNGVWIKTNEAFQHFLGYSGAELQEMSFPDVTHPDEWEADKVQVDRLRTGEIQAFERAKRYIHKDGHVLWGLVSATAVHDPNGEAEFFVVHILDITARKRIEESLARSNALMEESQAIAKVGGWSLDLETGSLYWTEETYRIHEVSPEEFDPTVDAGLGYFLPDSKHQIELALKAALEVGTPYDLELQTHTTKGSLIEVRTTGTPTWQGDKIVRLSGIFQDITERKNYERELKEARASAELAAQSKGQFLANMSHEIRTPMNAILGLLHLLQSTDLTSRQRDYASKTDDAAKSLLGLLNDILDFSKVEAGKMTLESEPMRLARVLRNISVVLSANVGAKEMEVLFDVDPHLPDVVRGDALRLQQILINLGGNAVKFTGKGQVVLALKKLASVNSSVTIEFSITDTGIGIAQEHQSHIFTGFSQAEGSTTRKFGGTGLGLAISKRLIELMGGEIRLHSEVGKGSKFSFAVSFPVVQDIALELAAPSKLSVPAQRVLVVDDNPVAAHITASLMRAWGWHVDLAGGCSVALELIHSHSGRSSASECFPYSLIVTDWQLPGVDGWECLRQIKQLANSWGVAQPLFIMVSANGRESLGQRSAEEQDMIGGFLVKPITASMLMDAFVDAKEGNAGIRKISRGINSKRQLAGMRILVVEDNLINQQVADELLSAEGAIVSLAANGRLGVDAVAMAAPQFDVVLMDIQMPVMDGYAATSCIRNELGLLQLPIVAMTANAMASDRDACIAAGMNEHVGKPFDMAKLVSLLILTTKFSASDAGSEPYHTADAVETRIDEIEGIELHTALSRMSGAKSLYVRTARDFISILDTIQGELHAQFQAGNKRKIQMILHTLKGNAATLGVTAMANEAARMETLCKTEGGQVQCDGEIASLGGVAVDAQLRLRKAIAQLEPAKPLPPSAETERDRSPQANEAALAVLHKLSALLVQSDLEVLMVFAQHREILLSLPGRLGDQLDDALQGLDMEQANAICQQAVGALELAR
jgi:PAS domain S-box-containing protein